MVPVHEIGGTQPRKSGGSELRKSTGSHQRKSCIQISDVAVLEVNAGVLPDHRHPPDLKFRQQNARLAFMTLTRFPYNQCPRPAPLTALLVLLTACGSGGGPGATAPAAPPSCGTAPAAPSTLMAASVTASGLVLDWTATSPANCISTYTVLQDDQAIATGLATPSLSVSGLIANHTYRYTVTATDAVGTSATSTALSVTTATTGTILQGITITGRLIWHSYDTYGFSGVRSWMANFDTGTVTDITPSRLAGAMNYHFSPDGQVVVVMADDNDETTQTGRQAWDLFVASVTPSGLTNLTKLTHGQADGSRNEDPKFSADGSRIIFKHNLTQIASIDVSTVAVNGVDQTPAQTVLLQSTTEVGMPYFLQGSNRDFLYADSVTNAIWLDTAGQPRSLYAVGNHAYYPIALDTTRFYFAAGQANDWIYRGDTAGSSAVPAAFITAAVQSAEFADPFPVTSDWLVYTSTAPGGSGTYDLWIGNFTTGIAYNLNGWIRGANHSNSDLGPTFHGTLSGP